LFIGFFLSYLALHEAVCTLKQITHDYKKKKKKKKKKQAGMGHEPLQQHLQRLKSQYHEKSSALSPTHLSSPMMATASGLTLSHLPSSPVASRPRLLQLVVLIRR